MGNFTHATYEGSADRQQCAHAPELLMKDGRRVASHRTCAVCNQSAAGLEIGASCYEQVRAAVVRIDNWRAFPITTV